MIDLQTRILQLRHKHACIAMQLALKRIALAYGFKYAPDQPRDDRGRWTSGGGMGGSLGSLGQNLLGDLASSVLPGMISGLAGGLGDLGSGLGDLGGGLDPTALDSGLDTTALGNGLSNGIDFTPTGSVIGTAPDGTPIDNAVLAQGDGAGVDRVSDLSSSLEELGGGVPKLVLTPKGATQFIFPNGMILRFDLQPGQYLNGQSPHINIEYNGDNIHIPMI